MPAWRSPRAWALLLVVVAAGLSLDLVSKWWAFRAVADAPVELRYEEIAGNPSYRLPWHAGVRVIPGDLLDFRLVLNHGAVFGLGQQRRPVFVAFTVLAVVGATAVFGWWTKAGATQVHLSIGLVLAGGLGNLYDRITFGAVRDFLHMLPRRDLPFNLAWPGGTREVFPWVFNIADAVLLLGMAILILQSMRADTAARRQEKAAQSAPAQP